VDVSGLLKARDLALQVLSHRRYVDVAPGTRNDERGQSPSELLALQEDRRPLVPDEALVVHQDVRKKPVVRYFG
jgi:hypothetical protein